MQHIGAVMEQVLGIEGKDPEEAAMIPWVHEIVSVYCELRSVETLREVKAMTTGAMRVIAFASLSLNDPLRVQYKTLFEDLIRLRADATLLSDGRWYSTADLAEAEVHISKLPDGRTRVAFPVRYPWEEPPDPETGFEGIRRPAVYRTDAERQAMPDLIKAAAEKQQRARPWWMPKDYQGPRPGQMVSPLVPVGVVPDGEVPW